MEQFTSHQNNERDPASRGAGEEKVPAPAKAGRIKKALLLGIVFAAFFGAPAAPPAQAQENHFTRTQDGDLKVEVTVEKSPEGMRLYKKKAEKLRGQLEQKGTQEDFEYLESIYSVREKPSSDRLKRLWQLFSPTLWARNTLEKRAHASPDEENLDNGLLASNYDLLWNKEEILKRAERERKFPEIAGFEKIPGYTNEKVKAMIAGLPRELLDGIDEILYVPEKKEKTTYHLFGSAEDEGGIQRTMHHAKDDGKRTVKIYEFDEIQDREELKSLIVHEIFHLNDWGSSVRMTMKDRDAMLADWTRWFLNPKRPRSGYVDDMFPKNGRAEGWNENEIQYLQVCELWAESVQKHREILLPGGSGAVLRMLREEGYRVPHDLELVVKWLDKMEVSGFTSADEASQNNAFGPSPNQRTSRR